MPWGLTDNHYNDVIMSEIASQITCVSIVYLTVSSGAYQIKHQSFAPLAFVRGIHWWQGNSPHKGPVTRKINVSIWRRHHEVDIGLVNGLMPTGNQPVTWTNIDSNLYRHMTSLGHNAFNRYTCTNCCVILLILISVWRYYYLYLFINDSLTQIIWRIIVEMRVDYDKSVFR